MTYRNGNTSLWSAAFVILIALNNPLIPLGFASREVWSALNVFTVIVLFLHYRNIHAK